MSRSKWLFCLLTSVALAPVGAAERVIAAGGRSDYVVCLAADAPPSITLAAAEIQRVIKLSTGAELPVVETPAAKMICLGDHPAARQAKVTADGLPDDGFRIRTVGECLYIVGKDYPGDQPPWRGWQSRGTLTGTYDFLERVVGVRWLLPGEWGEDVPRHERLVVPDLALEDLPDFAVRGLSDIQERRPPGDKAPSAAREWLLRNKLPAATDGQKMGAGHSWNDYLPESVMDEHPEYLAQMTDGKPYRPQRFAAVKYCTTNEELLRVFAEGVVRVAAKRGNPRVMAISPSDGGFFCQCPKCQTLVETDPHGKPSYTPLILEFYNDVARLVAKQRPDLLLTGLVYYNYEYPPLQPTPMEPAVWLVWAPLNYYGFGLMKPLYRDEFASVLEDWLKVTPNFVYHDYSTWMRSYNGAPLPVGLAIQKLEMAALKRGGAKGADLVGVGAWGVGGPSNYLRARMMWDADADADAVLDDWFQRAYGPGWPAMRELYRKVDAAMAAHKEQETPSYFGAMYEVNLALAEKVYLPLLPEFERLYGEALGKAASEPQRKRLQMFADNLIQLHWGLRQAGLLPRAEQSVFYRTDAQYQQFLADNEYSLAIYRDHGKRYTGPIWKGEWSG